MDKEFVEDTSVVLQWEPIRGAEWYDVKVRCFAVTRCNSAQHSPVPLAEMYRNIVLLLEKYYTSSWCIITIKINCMKSIKIDAVYISSLAPLD